MTRVCKLSTPFSLCVYICACLSVIEMDTIRIRGGEGAAITCNVNLQVFHRPIV